MDLSNDRGLTGMTQTLGDFAHLQKFFSTRPTKERLIVFQFTYSVFTVKADAL
jgi:hypothetical protein